MNSSKPQFNYDGPIFDAHTHVVDLDDLAIQVRIGETYGVKKALLIVHGDVIKDVRERYPHKFIYAKYFSGWVLMGGEIDQAVKEAKVMREEGYLVAKMHFAPFWRTRLETDSTLSVDDSVLDPLFDCFRDNDIPVLIHISDPDTYYATRYPAEEFGTKDEHLQQFEHRMKKSDQVQFQIAHFGAQPEIHRLENLARWFHENPKLYVDTGSARWIARELSKDPIKAREFVTKYSDRILFGTDCVSRTDDVSYYDGRYLAERLLWETEIRNEPLPFTDADTQNSGGTFINGLALPENVLSRLYWENAEKLYLL